MRVNAMAMQRLFIFFVAAILCTGCGRSPRAAAASPAPQKQIMSWSDVTALPQPPALPKIAYGSDPLQFGELSLPPGTGPFPVVMLVHGGCWLSDFDYVHARPLAAAMAREGYAVWNIEYRRLGNPGGGWPNTFLDAAAALDYLRVLAKQQPLDVKNVIVAGHSAGGQLALWLPTRAALPADSPLYVAQPLAIRGVIGMAPISDLYTYRIGAPDSCNSAVDPLLGGAPDQVPDHYAQTSPLQRLPAGVPEWLIQGAADPIVPPAATAAYAEAARKAGDTVTYREIAGAGHFENVIPDSPTWPAIVEALHALAPPAH